MRSYWVRCFIFVCVAVLYGGPLVPVCGAQEDGDLRLPGGAGRLEVYHTGEWGTVCDDRFTNDTAGVACRQLGYAGGTFYTAAGGSGPIWLDSVECVGNEARLAECRNDGWGIHDCSHAEDVGVSCYVSDITAAAFSLSVSSAEIAEGESTTLTLAPTNGATFTQALPVTLVFGGSAGTEDFTAPTSLTLEAGATSVTATLSAVEDIYKEGAETIAVTAKHGTQTLGQATVTISASVPKKFSLSVSPAKIAEGESTTLTLAPTNGATFTQALPVTLVFGGSAGTEDFTVPASYTFEAGKKVWILRAVKDIYKEGAETIAVTAKHGAWTLGQATVTIKASGPKKFSLSVSSAEIAEGESTTLTVAITKGGTLTQALPITLAFGGSAVASDFAAPASLTLAAGETAVTGTLSAVNDTYAERAETIAVTARYGVRTLGQATVTISASDLTNPTTPIEGTLRLQGDTALAGRLEVYHVGQWGTVCNDRFTDVTAGVACRQLGHAGGTFYQAAGGSGPIWLDSVECEGDEARLDACPHDGWGIHDCSHREDVGVSCESDTSSQMSPSLPPLTARFDPAPPATHTGSGTFTVRIRFSADVTIGEGKLRRRGLEVTGGTVTRAWKVKGRKDLWKIRIRPTAATTDVTITVPANRACNVTGALCTADGRQLSAPLTHTVQGQTTLLQSSQGATRGTPGAIAPPASSGWVPLEIPDAALHAALRQALGTASGVSLTAAALATVTTLDLSDAGITDLTGLEQAHNLESLSLGGNQITALEPLAELSGLLSLELADNQITDLHPLAGLVDLEFLSLGGNQITALEPLAELSGLLSLELADNQITDLRPLAGLVDLEFLSLGGNQITALEPLAELSGLLSLELADNQIIDLRPLAGLVDLEFLSLGGNQITDFSPLAGLPEVTIDGQAAQARPAGAE